MRESGVLSGMISAICRIVPSPLAIMLTGPDLVCLVPLMSSEQDTDTQKNVS